MIERESVLRSWKGSFTTVKIVATRQDGCEFEVNIDPDSFDVLGWVREGRTLGDHDFRVTNPDRLVVDQIVAFPIEVDNHAITFKGAKP